MLRQKVVEPIHPREVKFLTKHHAVAKTNSLEKHIVGNFIPLNRIMVSETAETKDPMEIVAQLAKWEWKMKTDLTKGFYMIPTTPRSKPYLAFAISGRTFTYNQMPIGVRNGPATFSQVGRTVMTRLPQRTKIKFSGYKMISSSGKGHQKSVSSSHSCYGISSLR